MATDESTWVTELARDHGFDVAGLCALAPSAGARDAYRRWIAAGMHGEMRYMARPDRVERALDPARAVAGGRAALIVAAPYRGLSGPMPEGDRPRGRVSAYALGPDYHDGILPRLEGLGRAIDAVARRSVSRRAYVDAGAFLERDAAARAGLGFVGRNTMLIRPGEGSLCFLAELILDLPPGPPAAPSGGTCGACTRCMDACPTAAFPAPGVLDARRCISYLTIEHRGPIDRRLRGLMGDWIFGCDVCNDVCPYNRRFGATTRRREAGGAAPDLEALLALDDAAFAARYGGTAIARAKRRGLARNACIALGNAGRTESVPVLRRALEDGDALVRGHAAWALGRIGGGPAIAVLARAASREGDAAVVEEIRLALDGDV